MDIDGAGIINNNDIVVIANAEGGGDDTAIAMGVAVTDTDRTTFLNAAGATMAVTAEALETSAGNSTAFAGAVGVWQSVSEFAAVTNLGTISVLASAGAQTSLGGSGVQADATAIGIAQNVQEGTSAVASNAGILNVSALAYGTGDGAALDINAYATGIDQAVQNSVVDGNVLASAANFGNMHIVAKATAAATGSLVGDASGGAIGVIQDVSSWWSASGNAQAIFSNAADAGGPAQLIVDVTVLAHGGLTATSDAIIAGSNVFADAEGALVIQDVSTTNEGNASATVINNGLMDLHVAASAFGITSADASAHADGIEQLVNSNGTDTDAANFATANVVNNDTIHVTAVAFADISNTGISAGDAHADAEARGIFQDVFGSSNAFANVTNDGGHILVNATASAIADTGVTTVGAGTVALTRAARASADATGILQNVDADGTSAVAVFSNLIAGTGTAAVNPVLEVNANAFASGNYASAFAFATGVSQNVNQQGGISTVEVGIASVVNEGGIDVDAVVTAIAHNGSGGFANAYAVGITQDVDGSSRAFAFVSNDSGRISINATANATVFDVDGDTGDGYADAFAEGINQLASGTATDGDATAQIFNDGVIYVGAHANADVEGSGDADAIAFATGAYQNAEGGASAQALFTNTNQGTVLGVFSVEASGQAFAEGFGDATVNVFAGGLFQTATASSGDALASAVNHGQFNVAAVGTAGAYNGDARVYARALGIEQDVDATGAGSAVVINGGGTLVVSVSGLAQDTNNSSDAAVIASGIAIDQDVTAGDTANALVSNDGTIEVGVVGTATGSWSAFVNVQANGIYQSASATGAATDVDENANATFRNIILGTSTGLLSVHGTAVGVADFFANVNATVTGVSQYASAEDTASATVINDGTIDVAAVASVSAGWTGNAYAAAAGIRQFATASGDANALVDNAGNLSVEAVAVAVGGTDGWAYAQVEGVLQDVSGGANATASILNTGVIDLHASASATATGTGTNRTADAIALVPEGLLQLVQATDAGGANALATITNDGSLLVAATAFASAYDAFARGSHRDCGGAGCSSPTPRPARLWPARCSRIPALFSVVADASAITPFNLFLDAGTVTAQAIINWVTDQSVGATGVTATAVASVLNSGTVLGHAKAYALGFDALG